MPYSQNGYLGLGTATLQRKYLTVVQVPGTDRRFRVRKGDVATVLEWAATRYHHDVESLTAGHPNDDWSFAYRSVRGSGSLSNHASGTACDYNATQHPLGTSPLANFSAKERRAIGRILADADGVLRWGGNYSGRKDGMHFEIVGTPRQVKKLAKKIRNMGVVMEPYILGTAVPMNLDAGVEHTVKWNKGDDGTGYALATGGSRGQVVDATVALVFADLGGTDLSRHVNGLMRFYAYDTKTGDCDFYEYRSFTVGGPYPSFPSRTVEEVRHGKVYPGKHLRVAVTMEQALQLAAGRCDV